MDFANGLYYPSALSSLLTTTRASTGYAANSSGLLVSFLSNIPRITDLGLLVEQAATNVVLWNRDLTNAAWTKSNITAALNQTGADGTANAATSLTATAGNGTCLQAITLASSARFQSAYVKRLTGSGAINMTLDNGATWTAIVVTAAYTKLTIPTQTLANPTVGFRIVTSGDAIAVDLVGNETGTFATSPIATTTVAVTRAADVISLSAPSLATNVGSVLFQASGSASASNSPLIGATRASPENDLGYFSSGTQITAYIGGTKSAAILGSGTFAGALKYAIGFDATGHANAANNGTVGTDSTVFNNTGILTIGNLASGTEAYNGFFTRITVWGTRLPNASLKALTQ